VHRQSLIIRRTRRRSSARSCPPSNYQGRKQLLQLHVGLLFWISLCLCCPLVHRTYLELRCYLHSHGLAPGYVARLLLNQPRSSEHADRKTAVFVLSTRSTCSLHTGTPAGPLCLWPKKSSWEGRRRGVFGPGPGWGGGGINNKEQNFARGGPAPFLLPLFLLEDSPTQGVALQLPVIRTSPGPAASRPGFWLRGKIFATKNKT
jgi:hypothetical protein